MKLSEQVAELERVRDHLSEDLRVRDESIDWLEAEVERLKEMVAIKEAAVEAWTMSRDEARAERDAARAEVERLRDRVTALENERILFNATIRQQDAEIERLRAAPVIIDPEEREKLRKLGKIP